MPYDDPGWNEPEKNVTARDFVLERLGSAESPMAPAELANEYGCTNGHLRNLLSDLMDEGVVERPRHGRYVLASGGEADDDAESAADNTVGSPGNADSETSDSAPNDQGENDVGSPLSADQAETNTDSSVIGTVSTAAIGGLGLLSTADRERVVYFVLAVTLLVIGYMLLSPSSKTGDQTGQEPSDGRDEDSNVGSDVPLLGRGGEY